MSPRVIKQVTLCMKTVAIVQSINLKKEAQTLTLAKYYDLNLQVIVSKCFYESDGLTPLTQSRVILVVII